MKKIEQTITSMEVAEMIGREHNALLKTIRTFISHMEKIAEGGNDHGSKEKYFKGNTYEDANGQRRPCFNVTKKGCEFIAHKMNGIKGTEFTMLYIDRFHEMDEALSVPKLPKNPMELLELHYEAIKHVDKKVDTVSAEVKTVKAEVESIKSDLPLLPIEADEIVKAVKKKGVEVLCSKQSPAYQDRGLRQRVYNDIYANLKHNFNDVRSYKAIRRRDALKAVQVVSEYKPPLFLSEQIEQANSQLTINDIN